MKIKLFLPVLLLIAFILNYCTKKDEPSDNNNLITTWKLISISDSNGSIQTPEVDVNYLLTLEDSGLISGSDGCNIFFGNYFLNSNVIYITIDSQTLMECFQSKKFETEFKQLLSQWNSYTTNENNLELFNNNKSLLFINENN